MSLSILTLNLWNESGPYAVRAGRIREWIDALSPDLVGFQEAVRWPDGEDPVAELLAGSGYQLDFAAGSPFWHEGQEQRVGVAGNAVASRWPIRDREELQLPHGGDGEKRAALSVTLDSEFGPVGLTCTHLNWKFDHGAIREINLEPAPSECRMI